MRILGLLLLLSSSAHAYDPAAGCWKIFWRQPGDYTQSNFPIRQMAQDVRARSRCA
ncbi:MAG TPA: hypothetical protein VM598_07325 [Bdellovibrionota bacterium]|nr:hypothetical protein [Bdellovibrionota bacterium]